MNLIAKLRATMHNSGESNQANHDSRLSFCQTLHNFIRGHLVEQFLRILNKFARVRISARPFYRHTRVSLLLAVSSVKIRQDTQSRGAHSQINNAAALVRLAGQVESPKIKRQSAIHNGWRRWSSPSSLSSFFLTKEGRKKNFVLYKHNAGRLSLHATRGLVRYV